MEKIICRFNKALKFNFLCFFQQFPIYGLTVDLENVPEIPEGFKIKEDLENDIFSKNYMIDFVSFNIWMIFFSC